MPLFNTGTFVIEAGTSGATTTETYGSMKSKVAKVISGENQTYYLGLAGEFILRSIDWVNMRHLFRFGSQQGTDTTLVAGTATYSIPADTFAVHEVQLIDASGDVYRTLEYVPWGQFNQLEAQQDDTGLPQFWTARNKFTDQKVQLYPEPDTDATVYDLRITSYERVTRPTIDTDVINAPRELTEVLLVRAEYHMLRMRYKDNPTLWLERKQESEAALRDFVHSTEREPTETLQWTMGYVDNTSSRFDPLGW